jgi:hypothetical protein
MLSKRISLFALILVLVITPAPPRLWAQDSAIGTIRGTVLDASGGRIAQASIVVVNTATGRRYNTSSPADFYIWQPNGDDVTRARRISPLLLVTRVVNFFVVKRLRRY